MSDDGLVLAWDGEAMGELEVRGPCRSRPRTWETRARTAGPADGWFKTGDVVTIDADGNVRICDRSKDVIKSGGEWISSVALENARRPHEPPVGARGRGVRRQGCQVGQATDVAAVVFKKDSAASEAELTAHLDEEQSSRSSGCPTPMASSCMDQIPRTSTGKFLKRKLRELYGHLLLK